MGAMLERKHLVYGAAAGFAVGIGGGLVWRHLSADKGKKPIPLGDPRQPGTDTAALEVDKATNIITVRTAAAKKLFELLKGYALEPQADSGQGEQARFTLVTKSPTAPESASAASWLLTAADAGFDVLIDERLTAILAGGKSPEPSGAWLSSVVITRPADTVKFATYPAMKYAVLFNGNPKGSGAFPAPPGYASAPAVPATASPSAEIAKEVTGASYSEVQKGGALMSAGILTGLAAMALRQYKRDGRKYGWSTLEPKTDAALLATGVVGGGVGLYGLSKVLSNAEAVHPAGSSLSITTATKGVMDKIGPEQKRWLGGALACGLVGAGVAAVVKQYVGDARWGMR